MIYTFPIKMIVVSTVFRRDTKNCNNASISAAVVFLVHTMPEKFENATNNGHIMLDLCLRNGTVVTRMHDTLKSGWIHYVYYTTRFA